MKIYVGKLIDLDGMDGTTFCGKNSPLWPFLCIMSYPLFMMEFWKLKSDGIF